MPVPQDVLRKVRKLVQFPEEVRRSQWAVSVTRLTVLKSLCRDPSLANRFVFFLARKTWDRLQRTRGRLVAPRQAKVQPHRQMMAQALEEMEAWIQRPSASGRRTVLDLLQRMQAEQNEYKPIKWGSVRIIRDWDLLLFEYALRCLLSPPSEAGHWGYQMARHYTERSEARSGPGLTRASAPLLQEIADFWIEELGIEPESMAAPAKTARGKVRSSSSTGRKNDRPERPEKTPFTHRQGQFLAFIHLYRKLHRRGPAEFDMVRYFRVTPPSVHGMITRLEHLGLVTREPGVPRSIRTAISEKNIPPLEEVVGPPW